MKNRRLIVVTNSGVKINLTILSVFLFLLYPYFNSITKLIYRRESIAQGTLILSVILLLITADKIRLEQWTGLWFAIIYLCVFRNYDLRNGNIYSCIQFVVCILMLILLSTKSEWEGFSLKLIYIFSIMHLIFGFFFYINKNIFINYIIPTFHLDEYWEGRLMEMLDLGYMVGMTTHYSTLGMYLAIAFVLGITYLLNIKITGIGRVPVIIFTIMTSAAFMLNGKRGPFIFTVVSSIFVYLVFYSRVSVKTLLKWFFYALLITGVTILAFQKIPALSTLFNRFGGGEGSLNDYTSDRIDLLWIPAIKMFWQQPIFGLGWRGFRYTFQEYSSMYQMNDTHNIFLQLLCETGIVGFLLVMTAFFTAYYRTAKLLYSLKKKQDTFRAETRLYLCFSIMVQTFFLLYGLTGNPLYDRIFYLYVIAYALMVSAERRIKIVSPSINKSYALQGERYET